MKSQNGKSSFCDCTSNDLLYKYEDIEKIIILSCNNKHISLALIPTLELNKHEDT